MTKNKVRIIFSALAVGCVFGAMACTYGLFYFPDPGKGTPFQSMMFITCFFGIAGFLFAFCGCVANVAVPQVLAREWDEKP
jgi:hypothetical protein